MREGDAEALADPQHRLRERPPFLALIVGAVVRDDDAQSEQARERGEQCGPDGMQMQHVGPLDGSVEHAEQRVDGRLDESAFVGSRDKSG